MSETNPKNEVIDFWTAHPLGSYEIRDEIGTDGFFSKLEAIREDSSGFVMDFYGFTEARGQKVLDVGCGPGWISHRYAQGGAEIFSMDITTTAIGLAGRYFKKDGLSGNFVVGDAEHIPFRSDGFDRVTCDGVLHHTPGTQEGITEISRVLKSDGVACISFYYKNILLYEPFFFLTKALMRFLGVRMHGAKAVPLSLSREEFGKWYDGVDNPLGRIFSRSQCARMFQKSGLKIIRCRVFYFPKRFFPYIKNMPRWVHQVFDRSFGTMIFFEVKKI